MRGCADLTVSDDGMSTERHHDVTTVLCNQTGERWHVLCRDGQWFGVPLTNCSSRREYRIIIIIIIIIIVVIIAVAAPAQKTSQVISRSENPQARLSGVRGVARIFSVVHFFLKKVDDLFLVVAFKTQAVNAADCFTVKIKQIKRSDMVTLLFSVHTITEVKQ